MTTPKFILELRAKVGHDLLWLTGLTGIVLDDQDRILLVQRADTGRWALIGGILEPGEQPAVALVREIHEETAVDAEVERLIGVETFPPAAYPNGDQVQFLDLAFRCRPLTTNARVNDDESLDVRWWPLATLPPLRPEEHRLIARALSPTTEPYYVTSAGRG
ncbi:NUDIX domain-containing protein [Kribbella sandramycini]|uniref:ADP-ribose pyrophosphatase YjhB (NUDIX family) n=1 Tax=Kribbella sandramycini TaxID=60450 RepID=A0A7Y4KV84_9ACTN|nr:NUDIX domain-containing protein [Kribbella sandramycini]MBB6568780.1 ADP-ribose pyrophosphatase YjhB (NUDIX family) [Kribbella sandramycini]NOL38637.1 NUDIX domain-containing protein [Kribbella sandramycini]